VAIMALPMARPLLGLMARPGRESRAVINEVCDTTVLATVSKEEKAMQPPATEMPRRAMFDFFATLPSAAYLYAMLGSVLLSALLYVTGKRHAALFVGEWVPTILLTGLFYKLLRPSGEEVPERIREAFHTAGR
jgi:hypothetical protein